MQDRFKFRVWNTLVKKFSYFDKPEIQIGTDGFDKGLIFPLSENSNLYMGKYFKPQFCTGLKDKDGKLIYEGDVIKYLGGTVNKKFVKYITKWNYNMGQFYISKINPSEYDNWKDWHLGRHDLDYEVIGNIYENPELLEG